MRGCCFSYLCLDFVGTTYLIGFSSTLFLVILLCCLAVVGVVSLVFYCVAFCLISLRLLCYDVSCVFVCLNLFVG